MKKIFIFLTALIIFLLSCAKQPDDVPLSDNLPEESTQPALTDPEISTASQVEVESEINPIVKTLFSGSLEKLSFDDIVKNISGGNMTAKLIDESLSDADAKISAGDDVYYPVKPNVSGDIKISPLDTFMEILTNCGYIETDPLNEHIIYTFIFHAFDIDGEKNEICVYVTRSCIRFTYNGVSDGKEYANMFENYDYINICGGYDFFIGGIIPDENGQLATIW